MRTNTLVLLGTTMVAVGEFRERIASFVKSDTPVAVTRPGESRFPPAKAASNGGHFRTLPYSLEHLRQIIEPLERELYGAFEREAGERLRGRDESDWPGLVAAPALAPRYGPRTQNFFRTGIAVWTSSRVEIFLRSPDIRRQHGEE